MLKLHKTCGICKAVKGNKVLLNSIYNTSYYMKTGPSLMQLAKDHQLNYHSLRNHCKKHQFLSTDDYNERHLRQIAKVAEKQIIERTIKSKDVWDTVINQGMEKLQSGEMQLKTSDLLKAAKDKSDFEFKQKDQQLAMMDMVFHFASGENKQELTKAYDRRIVEGQAVTDYDSAEELTNDSGQGTDRPGDFYQSLAGNAPAPGSSQVS